MPYVQRNNQGNIVAVSMLESAVANEWLDEQAPEIAAFMQAISPQVVAADQTVVQALSASDLALIRVVEDVIDLLIDQNLMRFTDLPIAVQEKLMQRRSLRQGMNALKLMGDDNDVI
ncbi:MAG: hypothetical protein KUL75_05185 [Sterolibacterium sp.]|nr:hypothetical protein [Sterolibacterium sp.]